MNYYIMYINDNTDPSIIDQLLDFLKKEGYDVIDLAPESNMYVLAIKKGKWSDFEIIDAVEKYWDGYYDEDIDPDHFKIK